MLTIGQRYTFTLKVTSSETQQWDNAHQNVDVVDSMRHIITFR